MRIEKLGSAQLTRRGPEDQYEPYDEQDLNEFNEMYELYERHAEEYEQEEPAPKAIRENRCITDFPIRQQTNAG